jgi:hypothetical protein
MELLFEVLHFLVYVTVHTQTTGRGAMYFSFPRFNSQHLDSTKEKYFAVG